MVEPHATGAREQFPDVFELIGSVEELTREVLGGVRSPSDDAAEIFSAALLARAYNLFIGVRLLSEGGLPGPAAAVLRSLQELQMVAIAIANDEGKLQLVIDHAEHQRRRALKNLSRVPAASRADHVTDEAIANVKKDVDAEAKETTVWQWAAYAGLEEEYRTAYGLLANEVHSSLQAIEEHLILDANGAVIGIRTWRGYEKLPLHIISACHFMLRTLSAMPEAWMSPEIRTRLDELEHVKQSQWPPAVSAPATGA
jgi:hypothetical protein